MYYKIRIEKSKIKKKNIRFCLIEKEKNNTQN